MIACVYVEIHTFALRVLETSIELLQYVVDIAPGFEGRWRSLDLLRSLDVEDVLHVEPIATVHVPLNATHTVRFTVGLRVHLLDGRRVENATMGSETLLSAIAGADDTPVGAHRSGLIGEDPSQPAGNLVPVIAQVAAGQREVLKIFGDDWPTPDGTAIRDYIHVEDLAHGHVLSLQRLLQTDQEDNGSHLVNLGTGRGYSVREVIDCYQQVADRPIRSEIVARRAGDAAISYADTQLADRLLAFRATHDLTEMCRSNWAFTRAKA